MRVGLGWAIGAGIGGLLVGGLVATLWRPTAAGSPDGREVAPAGSVSASDLPLAGSTGSPPDDAPAMDTCPAELAFLRGAYEALELEAFGPRRPFAEDLPPAFQPDGFAEAVDALVRECPELGLTDPMVDCEEFPCQVFFLIGEDVQRGFDSQGLNDCPAWDERMGGAGAATATDRVFLDGRSRVVVGFAPTPVDDAPPEDASKRTHHRFDLNRERFAEHVGGRPLTDPEQAQSWLRMMEARLEGAPDPEQQEFYERMVERARARVEGLR